MKVSKLIVAAALAAAYGAAHAGPIDPPAGPVTPTMKTLQQVEPRIPINAQTCPGGPTWTYGISQPGSYYLTGDLAGESGKYVIRVGASNVTIDLNGFSIVGGTGSHDGVNGSILEVSNVTVRNGTIRNCGGRAVATEPTRIGWLVENVKVLQNGSGLYLPRNSIARDCIVSGNSGTGISALWGSTVQDCAVNSNLRGISVGYGTTVIGCSAQYNNEYGINAYAGSTVADCSARHTTVDGFLIDDGSRISGCTATESGRDGIRLGTGCTAMDNSCSFNGPAAGQAGAGIRATGGSNRIEGNALSGNYYAVRAEAAGSFVARNTASGHTIAQPYSLFAGCTFGPVVSSTGQIATTSPWANFSY